MTNTENQTEPKQIPNPYLQSQRAKDFEKSGDYRAAEAYFRRAISAADALPLREYKANFAAALKSRKPLQEEVSEEDIVASYRELLCLPFLTRVQLAGFYARHGALPEAKEACDDAFAMPVDAPFKEDPQIKDVIARARDLQEDLNDILGPPDLVERFESHFDQLDRNKDGFVDQNELKRAQLDISIDSRGQEMIRHLLYHYFDVEIASNDEFGMEISGITKKDVRNFQKQSKAEWKRMGGKRRR